MRNAEKDEREMAIKRKAFLEKAFILFSTKGIEPVSMQDIADAAGYGVATLYRYFNGKISLVIEVSARAWDKYTLDNIKDKQPKVNDERSAAEMFEFYLDAFLDLYRTHKNLLRFNQFFNIYIKSHKVNKKAMKPYEDMIDGLHKKFSRMYQKAKIDKTIRTDVPEEVLFSTTLHLMLAVITRYAVGLAYKPSEDYEDITEIEQLKDMLMKEYVVK